MSYHWLLNPRWLVFVPLLMVLVIGVACGGDEATSTPQPTATPLPAATATPVPAATATPVPAATATPVPVAQPTPTAPPVMAKLEPKYGGVVPMTALGDPTGWDPHMGSNVEDLSAVSPMYNQVVEFNPLNPTEVIGDLAKSWDVSDDGLAYTFHLHDDVKWWDGQNLTAEDVAFSINRMIEEGEPRPQVSVLRQFVDRAEMVDQNTVRVHLKFSAAAFLPFLAVDHMKVVPKHVVETGLDMNTFNKNIVGSGPFKVVEYTRGNSYEFEKNPDYFKEGQPYFDGINAFLITDKGASIAAFRTERILMTTGAISQLDVEDVLRLEKDEDFMSKFDFWWAESTVVQYILLQNDNPPFDDERVRRAMFLAVDRQGITEGFGLGKFNLGAPVAPNNPYALPEEEMQQMPGYRQLDGKKHPEDIAEAQRLMNDAGYDDNNPLKVKFLVPIVLNWPDAAVVVKENLQSILPIDIELNNQDVVAFINELVGGTFQMSYGGTGTMIGAIDPDDPFQGVHLFGEKNFTHWSDPKVEELFKQQQQELDPEKRRELNHEMQRTVLSGAPGTIELAWMSVVAVVSKRIKTEVGHYVLTRSLYTNLKHDHEWMEPK